MNIKSNSNFKKYIIFWLSQSVSQLGSAMTGNALVLWAFHQTESAMSMSLMAFCNYVPYIIASLFAVRNAVQFGTIPAAILLGGFLAEYVFEPFIKSENIAAKMLQNFVGTGNGSGMAVMFLCTGIIGSFFSFAISKRQEMDELRYKKE
jgi:hypothetical protein